MGEVLAKAVEASACAARIGGDEFTVLLPGTDERGALAVQERISSLVDISNQFYPGQHLSLAMGTATCSSGDQVESTLHRADKAMYVEKQHYYQQQPRERRGSSDSQA